MLIWTIAKSMRVALLTSFAATRKEPLSEAMERVHAAFLDKGLGEPVIRFNFGDSPIGGGVSSVDRVLKRHPELGRFVTEASPMLGMPGARRISNGPLSAGAGESVSYATLHEIAAGVPRSFPFHGIAIHFYTPEFGELAMPSIASAEMICGILLSDSWWINGRNRSLSACTMVEADPAGKKLPPLPPAVAAVLDACGKVKKTIQAPLPGRLGPGPVPGVRLPGAIAVIPSANPEAAYAVHAIVVDYRARMAEVVARAALPHDLPPPGPEAYKDAPLGTVSGPKKPGLDRVFKPMGYTCKGGSGTLTLRRRTAANLTAELYLDVGTWSHTVLAMFKVLGVGFKATLALPVAAKALAAAQYPTGDADRWQKIAENLGALVRELDRSFVPEIEAAAGPSPEWY